MGTYCKIALKDSVQESQIELINQELETKGYLVDVHNGISYGAFFTQKMIQKDLRYMNEDPEGLKQVPHWTRPITAECLQENCFWIRHRQFCTKFGSQDDERKILLVANWAACNKELIGDERSDNWTEQALKERGLSL